MTRAEAALVDMFDARADRADEVEPDLDLDLVVVAHRRRSYAVPLAVAAAVIAIALAIVRLGAPSTPTQPSGGNAPVRSDPVLFRYGFTLDAAPEPFTIASRFVTADASRVVYDRKRPAGAIAGAADVLEAVVYQQGAYDPGRATRGVPVDVHGAPAFYGPAIGHVDNGNGADGTATVPSVVWEYAPRSWAVVTGTSAAYQGRRTELAIARTLHIGQPADVRVPFRLGHRPAGVALTSIATGTTQPADLNADARYGSALDIAVQYVPHQSASALFGAGGVRLRLAGHPAQLIASSGGTDEGNRLTVLAGDYVVMISSDRSVPTGELKAIAVGMTFPPDGADPDTWFSAASALDG